MDENLAEETYIENQLWKEQVLLIGRNFFLIYGALALVRDVLKFVCRK